MQRKPQDKRSATPTQSVESKKADSPKQPQPLDLKAIGQVAGGGRAPVSGW